MHDLILTIRSVVLQETQKVFGKYEVIRRIATGGMGEIFLARQRGVAGFDRLVILKSLLPDLAVDPDFVEQFLDEARIAAHLNHPNVVSILEIGEWEGVYFIAMEHVRGDSVSKLQRESSRRKLGIPWPVSAAIVRDAALGLDHAHFAFDNEGLALNIIHRDVSPQNVMVRLDGVVKVLDFGIAKSAATASRTSKGEIKGKLQYMPPEMIRGEPFDHRADQFSLGVLLWELCTGRRLFPGKSPMDIFRQILSGQVQKPSDLVPGAPKELEKVALRMLASSPQDRYPRLKEAANALNHWLDSHRVPADTVHHFSSQILTETVEKGLANLTPQPGALAGLFSNDVTCSKCGIAMRKGARFCESCGASNGGNAQAAPSSLGTKSVAPEAAKTVQLVSPLSSVDAPPLMTSPVSFEKIFERGVVPISPTPTGATALSGTGWTAAAIKELTGRVRHKAFVGRDNIISYVSSLLDDTAAVRGVLFVGGRGSGKSATLAAIAKEAARRKMNVFEAKGRDAGKGAHLDVVNQLLLLALGRLQGKYSWELDAISVLEYGHLSPEETERCRRALRGLAPKRALYDDPNLDAAALAKLLLTLPLPGGFCILVDDWDGVDSYSRQVLEAMARLAVGRRALVFGAAREIPEKSALVTLALEGLPDAAMTSALAHIFGLGGLPPRALQQVCKAAGGVPGFAEEYARSLIANGGLIEVQGAWKGTEKLVSLAAPDDHRQLLANRYSALSEDARRFLRWGAVSGNAFDAKQIAQALELGLDWRRILGECEEAWLIERHDGPGEMYAFCSTSMREEIFRNLPLEERQQVHQAMANVLRQRHPGVEDPRIVELIIRHSAAGSPDQFDALAEDAIQLLLRCGNQAGSAQYTEMYVEHNLAKLSRMAKQNEATDGEVLRMFGWAQRHATCLEEQEPKRASQLVTRVLQALPPQLQPLERAKLEHTLGRLYRIAGQYDFAERVLDIALERLAGRDELEAAGLLAELGKALEGAGDLDGAIFQVEESMRLAEVSQVAGADFFWQHQIQLGKLYSRKGNGAQAQRALGLAHQAATDSADVYGRMLAAKELAGAARQEGDSERMVALWEETLQLAHQLGHHRQEAEAASRLAHWHFGAKRFSEARQLLHNAVDLARNAAWAEGAASMQEMLLRVENCMTEQSA